MWSGVLVGTAVLMPSASEAASYAARVRWRAAADAAVAGYRVYTRTGNGPFALALDAGSPTPAGDGTLAAVASGLDSCRATGFVVTAYRTDGGESGLSNELVLTPAAVGTRLDSDGDGLADAAEDRDLDCRVDPGETDPLRADTDGDGVPDGADACQGTPAGAAASAAGCACSQVACDDGNACNGVETCAAGTCGAGAPPVCDDGDACTEDECSPGAGCRHARIGGCTSCGAAAACDDGDACTADACVAGRCAHVAIPGCCRRDRDCGGDDACRADVRCEAGRCVADPVACADPGPCATAACDPVAGCVTTPVPDGTPCGGSGTCGPRVCTAGVCGGAEPAPPAASAGADGDTRLTLKATANGLQVLARAALAGFPDDLGGHEVLFVVQDGAGATVLEAQVPGGAFERAGTDRALFRDDERGEGGGFVQIELRRRGAATALTLRALVPPAPGTRRAKVADAGRVAWSVRSADGCVGGGGRCTRRGRRCR